MHGHLFTSHGTHLILLIVTTSKQDLNVTSEAESESTETSVGTSPLSGRVSGKDQMEGSLQLLCKIYIILRELPCSARVYIIHHCAARQYKLGGPVSCAPFPPNSV